MALPSFLKRKASAAPAPDDATIVQQARARARRRLIGAAVLLAVGVVSFPLLFETQPRPIPVDIPIEIPRKDGLPPLAAPAKPARVVTGQVTGAREVAEPPSAAPAKAAAAVPAASAAVALPAAATTTSPAPAPAPKPGAAASPPQPEADNKPPVSAAAASAPKAQPAARPASAPAATAAADGGRFVVQVGAFADATAAREVRLRVEKLGLKTYTQVVETPQGKRIRVRVGPFDTQEDAGKVLARLKAAKLPGAVLTL